MSDIQTATALILADNPAVIAHMNALQGIISRLANNSASCKTWCLTLVSALISLAGAAKSPATISFVLLPIVVFGFLDTMYLSQEKAYRDHYDAMTKKLRDATYKLDDVYNAHASIVPANVVSALVSWSILPVYGGLAVAYVWAHKAGWFARLMTM